jgi:hypothetical protein
MTYEQAIQPIVDAAISHWSQHTYERDLRLALELVSTEPGRPDTLTRREREVISAWMAATREPGSDAS